MLDVNKVSIAWSDENATLIVKLVTALGYNVYSNTRVAKDTGGWAYLGGNGNEFNGTQSTRENHFETVEEFLKAHFDLIKTKSPAQIKLEEIQEQIKELTVKAKDLEIELTKEG